MNTFGSPTKQFALCDSRSVISNRKRFSRNSIDSLDLVNHFYCPAGRWPLRGWLLLPRYEYTQLDPYATNLQLNIGDTSKPLNLSTLKNLSIVQAQCVTRGLESDLNALYLIEITDARGVLHNEWFQLPTTSIYNIRAVGYPQTNRGGTFCADSMNGGTTWTWSTMIGNLWGQMSASLGTFPGLPYTPDSTPEGWYLVGVPAWYALNDMVEHIGMKVVADLQSASPYTIVEDNATDTSYNTLLSRYLPNLEEDLEWIDTGSGRVPSLVKVLFRRRNEHYGIEETVRYGPTQWITTPYYEVNVDGPPQFADAPGNHFIWSDFTVRYDMDGVPLAADVAYANTIAQQRVSQYYARISPSSYTTRRYAGSLPFKTGSQVDGILWSMMCEGKRLGWTTEVVKGGNPPWPEIMRGVIKSDQKSNRRY